MPSSGADNDTSTNNSSLVVTNLPTTGVEIPPMDSNFVANYDTTGLTELEGAYMKQYFQDSINGDFNQSEVPELIISLPLVDEESN